MDESTRIRESQKERKQAASPQRLEQESEEEPKNDETQTSNGRCKTIGRQVVRSWGGIKNE